jgi:hypothetical protein
MTCKEVKNTFKLSENGKDRCIDRKLKYFDCRQRVKPKYTLNLKGKFIYFID